MTVFNGQLNLMLCQCPCHMADSKVSFCWACYIVVCKMIRNAGNMIDTTELLAAPFKNEAKDIGEYELGR